MRPTYGREARVPRPHTVADLPSEEGGLVVPIVRFLVPRGPRGEEEVREVG